MRVTPFELRGRWVDLVPMTTDHIDGLLAAATEDRSTYGFTAVPDTAMAMDWHVRALVAAGERGHDVPFTTCAAADGRILGATRFLWLRSYFDREVPDAVEIGGTWLAASAQRTPVNTEAKLLMLTHAFEHWRVQRVDLKTDARNARSRAAIERIGGRLDGVMRAWQPSLVPGEEGTARDSALYSIVPSEWPDVKAGLEARLTR
ncbi:MAG: GNAT family N-acetyltransferase [Acidimicrobiia bacterium]